MMGYVLASGLAAIVVLAILTYLLKINVLASIGLGLVLTCVVNPLVYSVGSEIAKDQASTFNEYWNGYETEAVRIDTTCVKNGSCFHTFDCDPYQVTVMKYRSVPDGKGGTTQEAYPEQETRYDSCPYSTQETDFIVKTSLYKTPDFVILNNAMTGDQYRWGHNIPGGQVTEPPVAWSEAKQRIESGKPGPVTAVKDYKNYILASQKTLFKNYSGNIEDYKAKGLLPTPASGVTGFYHAAKAYKAGDVNVPLFNDYVTDLAYLNGAVGQELHGDLHVVFVPENVEGGRDDYMNTLKAYWQSEELKRNAISKNAIIVVIGVTEDGKEVAWANASTGMPLGNEGMLVQISSDLKGEELDADLIGRPTMNLGTKEIAHSSGKLEGILWGENAFVRVSMSGSDEDDEGTGFKYLRDELKPSTGDLWGMGIVNFLIGGLLIGGFIMLMINNVLPAKIGGWKGSERNSREDYRRNLYYF